MVPLASSYTPALTFCTRHKQPTLNHPGLYHAEINSGDPREELFMVGDAILGDHGVWILG